MLKEIVSPIVIVSVSGLNVIPPATAIIVCEFCAFNDKK
jgi:hypothetical protein